MALPKYISTGNGILIFCIVSLQSLTGILTTGVEFIIRTKGGVVCQSSITLLVRANESVIFAVMVLAARHRT